MFMKSYDKVLIDTPVIKELCDGGWFHIHMEPLANTRGHNQIGKTLRIWRVWYKNNNIIHAKHSPDKARAQVVFDEAVMFNGFLDEEYTRDQL